MGACDLVVVRAVAPLPVVAEYAAPLLRVGGSLVAWRGPRDPEDEPAGARGGRDSDCEVREPVRVEPYPGALHRHLHPMVKVARDPGEVPAGAPGWPASGRSAEATGMWRALREAGALSVSESPSARRRRPAGR